MTVQCDPTINLPTPQTVLTSLTIKRQADTNRPTTLLARLDQIVAAQDVVHRRFPGSVLPSGPPGPRPTRERSATVQCHGPTCDNTVVSARQAPCLVPPDA